MTKEEITIRQLDESKEFKMLGQGNTAEIYQFEDNRILKLFRDKLPLTPIQNEYRITRIIQNSLDNIPKAYEMVKYRNRYGIVYDQIKGNDMIQIMTTNAKLIKKYSRQLATTHVAMHKKNIDVKYSVKDKLCCDINSCQDLKAEEKDKIIRYLHALPDGDKICHFDYHPGNIMMSNDQLVVIDWMTACTGDPNADVARTMLLLQIGEIMHISKFKSIMIHIAMKTIGKEYIKEYRKLTGVRPEDIRQWMLPVAAARLAEWLTDHERAKLVKLVRKELALYKEL